MRRNNTVNKTKNLIKKRCLMCAIFSIILSVNNMCCVHAQSQNVQYEYDFLGRLIVVRYPDGTQIKYQYDVNGNVLFSEKVPEGSLSDDAEQSGDEQKGEGQSGDNRKDEEQVGNNQTGGNQSGNGQAGGNQSGNSQTGDNLSGNGQMNESQTGDNSTETLQYSAEDIKNYNKFKKSRPVIKSLKYSKKKTKYYLNICVKQIKKQGIYSESGYQVKYATNSKFKKAKTIKISRKNKGSITNKKWKVKKGKTYYVKVRAFMQTKDGKTIYSKYSKVKKIKVKKIKK